MALTIEGLEKWYVNTVKLKHAFAGTTPPDPIPLPDVTTIDGLLEGIVAESKEARIEAAIYAGLEHDTVELAYSFPLPLNMLKWVGVTQVGGRTIVYNQLVDTGTTEVTTNADHKYYKVIGGTASIVSGGSNIAITDDTKDMVINLSLMFGRGKEPTTVAEVQAILPEEHYEYDVGSLMSAGVTDIISTDADGNVLDTYTIPAEIQALTGYGWSAGTAYNYIDFENKKFVQQVGQLNLGSRAYTKAGSSPYPFYTSVPNVKTRTGANTPQNLVVEKYATEPDSVYYTSGLKDIGIMQNGGNIYIRDSVHADMTTSQFNALMKDVYLYFELSTPVETDISEYLTDDVIVNVVPGGHITFRNLYGEDYRIPVYSIIDYVRGA